MRIVVNDIAASKGGALSVLKDFYSAVKNTDNDNEWIFLLGDNYLEETDNIKVITLPEIKKNRFKKLWFDFVGGKRFIKKLKPDVVFSLQNIITFGLNVPQVAYIHQSIPFQDSKKFSFFNNRERGLAVVQYLIGAIIKLSAKKAQHVIVQTNWMKDAVSQKAKIESNKISVVMPRINIDVAENDGDLFTNQFFYPTSNAIYKNNSCIVKASEILYSRGIKEFNVQMTVSQNLHPAIFSSGYIDRSEVLEKYKTSVLIFPSYIESCPFPLVEARRLNSLILASNCPFSHEILKDYKNAYFFDPFNPVELADLMEKVIIGEIKKVESDDLFENGEDGWLGIIEYLYQQK